MVHAVVSLNCEINVCQSILKPLIRLYINTIVQYRYCNFSNGRRELPSLVSAISGNVLLRIFVQ